MLDAAISAHLQQDMDKVSAEDALDGLLAYYKVSRTPSEFLCVEILTDMQDELKYFIGVITKQVTERHLACPLPDLLSPVTIAHLTDEQVRKIASEPGAIARKRKELEDRKETLEAGQQTFRLAMINAD